MTRSIVLLAVMWTLLSPQITWAYTDPGTGALLLQLLFGGVAGLAIVLKLFWTAIRTRVVSMVRRSKRTDSA